MSALTFPRPGEGPPPGRFDVSQAGYRALQALSRSDFLALRNGPGAWRTYHEGAEREETPEMALGTALHFAIFEPDHYREGYVIAPLCHGGMNDATARGKHNARGEPYQGGKETLARFLADIEGEDVAILEERQGRVVEAIAKKARKLDLVRELCRVGGWTEQSFCFADPGTGIPCKTRPDHVFRSHLAPRTIVDLKSVGAPSMVSSHGFRRAVEAHMYDVQNVLAMWAMDELYGSANTRCLWLVWCTSPPYRVETLNMNEGWILPAEAEIRSLLTMYSEALRRDEWPEETGRILDCEPPRYMKDRTHDEWFRQGRSLSELPSEDPF